MEDKLAQRVGAKITVVCVGNRLRGDDGLGPLVADLLEGTVPAHIVDAGEMPENYTEQIASRKPDTVVFIDAVHFGGTPGDLAILESCQLPQDRCLTHRFPLALIMNYIKERTNADTFLLGVQPANIKFGTAVTAPIRQTAEWLVQCLQRIILKRRDLVDNGKELPECSRIQI